MGLAWIVGTATMLADVYNEVYLDPDTGEERLDEELRESSDDGEDYSTAALMSAITGYILGTAIKLSY
jgi:hypothetical protein